MKPSMPRILAWARDLTDVQAKQLVAELVYLGIEQQDISFNDGSLAPYCAHSGEPLVEGQNIYPDKD